MSEDKPHIRIREQSERESVEEKPQDYVLKLYVAGHSTRSIQAITSVKTFCETYLRGHYQLEIVDIYQSPEETEAAQIITIPTLLRKLPLPQRKLVGDLSNMNRLRNWLRLADPDLPL